MSTRVEQAQTITPDLPDLKGKTIIVQLKRSGFHNRAEGDKRKITTDADLSMVSMGKALLDSQRLREVEAVDREITTFLDKRGVKSSVVRSGWVIGLELVEETEAGLSALSEVRADTWNAFVDGYPEDQEAAQLLLKSQYNPKNYPTQEELRSKGTMFWAYFNLVAEGPARAKLDALLQDAAREYRETLREMLREAVAHLAERLEDGKVFRQDSATKYQAFLELFENCKGIHNDSELEAHVQQAKALMDGVTPAVVKKGEPMRSLVHDGLVGIKGQLDSLLKTAPRRALTLED